DVILPDGNGIDVAKKLKELENNLRIVATSGYIADEIDREDIAEEDFKFIEKPFSLEKIREILTELSGEIKNI
ncbi:MAG: response regulator, partial [Elusimicrobiota bacterium]